MSQSELKYTHLLISDNKDFTAAIKMKTARQATMIYKTQHANFS